MAQSQSSQNLKRYEVLDAVRGLATICVVIFHWPALLVLQGTIYRESPETVDRTLSPLYHYLRPIYDYGDYSLDLFFIISGFIFFLIYQSSITAGKTSARDFAALRFSRLYPLHLLTLFVVAALQILFFLQTSQWMAGTDVDVPHFIGNLFLINIPHMSFNYPTWSITVELLLYALFWVLARHNLLRGATTCIVAAVLGLALIRIAPHSVAPAAMIGRGLAGFFVGGLVFKLFQLIEMRFAAFRRPIFVAAFGTALVGWMFILVVSAIPDSFGDIPYFSSHHLTARLAVTSGLFPLSVLVIAFWSRAPRSGGSIFAWLGKISYSSYLLHFPIILLTATLSVYGLVDRDIGQSTLAMAGFLVVLIALSAVTYDRIEMPAQEWLRRYFKVSGVRKSAASLPSLGARLRSTDESKGMIRFKT